MIRRILPALAPLAPAARVSEAQPADLIVTNAHISTVDENRPMVEALARIDGHATLVNEAALRAAGVTAQTADPSGGRIERRADLGGRAWYQKPLP
jgi:predicted amidohydrolase YtcJ